MSASGAGVLQLRSVEYARNHGVRIHCRSSFEDGPGTLVVAEEETVEQPFVTAVTHSNAEARVTLTGVRDEPGVAGRIFQALADANVNVDVIIQNEPVGGDQLADLSFTVDRDDLPVAKDTIAALGDVSLKVRTDEQIGKVSIVGAGMRSHPGVAAKVFEVLGAERINIEMISTSPIKISCVIPADRVPDAVKALHATFELGDDAIRPEDADRARAPAHGRRLSRRHNRAMAGDGYRVGVRGRDRAGRDDDPRPARRPRLPRRRGGSLRLRSLGRPRAGVERLDDRLPGAERRLDPGPRRRPLLRRRRDQRRVDAAPGRGRRHRGRQHQLLAHARRRAAGRRRGQPRGPRRPQRHRRQPQLLDHADGRRAEAALRRGRDRAAGDLHLPGRLRHRQGGDRRADGTVARDPPRPAGRQAGDLPAADRLQRARPGRQLPRRRRPHRRGAQADQRDPQDPRRPGDQGLRHLRAGAGRDRPLRGGQRRDPAGR